MNPRTTIHIPLDTSRDAPLYQQIYEWIRDAISQGVIAPLSSLPSIRSMAITLAVSHTTVERAYLQLQTEGLIESRPRSGFRVAPLDTEFLRLAHDMNQQRTNTLTRPNLDAFFSENSSGQKARWDFSYANLQPGSFPSEIWRKLTQEYLWKQESQDLTRYARSDIPNNLCIQLSRLLARSRGLHCHPEQIIIQSGTDGVLTCLLQLFDQKTDVFGIEEPGYATAHEVALRLGYQIAPLRVGDGGYSFLESVKKARPKLIYTTPSHQFPTGLLLSLDVRTKLLKWAEEHDAYLIEDDSCNEFRYGTQPIPSLQSLDVHGRVIYICNISKTLSPSLRIAYMALPDRILERFWQRFLHTHNPVSLLEQTVLARFIEEGYWDSHVRKSILGNYQRHDELLKCLKQELGDMVELSGVGSGLHFFTRVNNGMNQSELLQTAMDEQVKVYGTSRMWFKNPPITNSVMIGFSAIAKEDIRPGIQALTRAWMR